MPVETPSWNCLDRGRGERFTTPPFPFPRALRRDLLLGGPFEPMQAWTIPKETLESRSPSSPMEQGNRFGKSVREIRGERKARAVLCSPEWFIAVG